MNPPAPHFLLFSESNRTTDRGQWRFVLQSLDGDEQLEATDFESEIQGERLELLAVVRGLEALPQPSRVTLVTPSRYVNRGLSYGLSEWRSNDWQWERFGEMAPVKNRDLWQRIDQALAFHSVDCRLLRLDTGMTEDSPQNHLAGPHFLHPRPAAAVGAPQSPGPAPMAKARPTEPHFQHGHSARRNRQPGAAILHLRRVTRRSWLRWIRRLEQAWENAALKIGRLGTRWVPPPWMG